MKIGNVQEGLAIGGIIRQGDTLINGPVGCLESKLCRGRRAGGGTAGDQPETTPDSEAKMNSACPVLVPPLTTKSDAVLLKTCPVGSPTGMFTSKGFFTNGERIPIIGRLKSLRLAERRRPKPK